MCCAFLFFKEKTIWRVIASLCNLSHMSEGLRTVNPWDNASEQSLWLSEALRCVHRCEGLSVLSESEAEQQASVLGGLWGRRCLWQRQQQEGQACRLHRPGQNCQGSKHEYMCWGLYNLGCLRWPSGISSQLLDVKERIPEESKTRTT